MEAYQKEKLFAAYFNGEHYRGSGGVVYVKDEHCSYMFAHEFTSVDFASQLQEAIDDGKENLFVVLEKESKFHLFSFKKDTAMQQMLTGTNTVSDTMDTCTSTSSKSDTSTLETTVPDIAPADS